MRTTVWLLALLGASAVWGQDPRVYDLSGLEPELPAWSPLGVPRLDRGSQGRLEPRRSEREGALEAVAVVVERAAELGAVEQSGLRLLTTSAEAAAVLERGLEPLRAQLRDLPLVRVSLVPLEAGEAERLALGPLSEADAARFAKRAPLARLSARPRGGWLNARSVRGQEQVVGYEVDQSGAVPVRTATLRRVSAGCAARLRVRRRADGAFWVEGVIECARPLDGARVTFDGLPLDLPAADRLRVVGAWGVPGGPPVLLAACSLPSPTGFGSWGLCLQVLAGPPPGLGGAAGAGPFVWRHDVSALLPASYAAVDVDDPFAGARDTRGQVEALIEERLEDDSRDPTQERLAELLDREDLPPVRERDHDGTSLYAAGDRAEQLRLAQLLASRRLPERRLRLRLDSEEGAAGAVLRVLALEGRPLRVVLARERNALVSSELLGNGCGSDGPETVAVPVLEVVVGGFDLRLEAQAAEEVDVEGALCAVLAERPLATRWGEFSQLERQRLQLSAHGVCAAGDRVALGAGPWAAGVARATLEVER